MADRFMWSFSLRRRVAQTNSSVLLRRWLKDKRNDGCDTGDAVGAEPTDKTGASASQLARPGFDHATRAWLRTGSCHRSYSVVVLTRTQKKRQHPHCIPATGRYSNSHITVFYLIADEAWTVNKVYNKLTCSREVARCLLLLKFSLKNVQEHCYYTSV